MQQNYYLSHTIQVLYKYMLHIVLCLKCRLQKSKYLNEYIVSYPGKGECADPVNEGAILEEEGGGRLPGPE
jgi:hypothetical protein